MKKADLEKLKGKKLDIRKGREAVGNRYGGASGTKRKSSDGEAGESLVEKLVRQALEKK
jgi:hypothetical protein